MIPPQVNPKVVLRRELRAALDAVAPEVRESWSRKICQILLDSQIWRAAQTILSFVPLSQEPDVSPLALLALAEGKTLCLPRFDSRSQDYIAAHVVDPTNGLVAGRYGIREPAADAAEVAMNRLDLVLVPGLGFGPGGRRLGRGKGHYDRLLAGISTIKCGIGFDLQWSDSIPHENCDVLLDCILTPERGLVWSRPRF